MMFLDQQYLLFREQADAVLAAFPQLEPLRHLIFKTFCVQKSNIGKYGWLEHWLRRLFRSIRRFGPLQKADVLFLLEGGRNLGRDMVLPVWNACRQLGIRSQLLALNAKAELPESAHCVQGSFVAAVPKWADSAWEALISRIPTLDNDSLRRNFMFATASAAKLMQLAGEIFCRVEPKLLVVTSNCQSGLVAFSTRARLEGRFTVQLQHGIPQAFYTPVLEDIMLTWGESSSHILQRLGVPTSKLRAVGSPRHDNFQPVPNARALFCRSLNLPDRPTLVFFSNGNDLVRNGNAPIESATWLEEAAVAIPHVNIVVKLHPNEDGALYRQTPHVRVIKNEFDLITILSAADVVASVCSTAMYEALLFGKPVWQFDTDGWPPLEDNWKQGLAIRVASSKELIRRIYQWMDTPDSCERWSRLSQRVFTNHGRAAAAAAEYLASLLQK
jgi:hypothetical protein